MRTWVSHIGTAYEWDDTFEPGDLIIMGDDTGYFEFSHYFDYSGVIPPEGIPDVVGKRVLNEEGAPASARQVYTSTMSASRCTRAEVKLEQRIDKKITEAAKLNKILELIKSNYTKAKKATKAQPTTKI